MFITNLDRICHIVLMLGSQDRISRLIKQPSRRMCVLLTGGLLVES
nr:hypothetical protein [Moraxella catarrhalis]